MVTQEHRILFESNRMEYNNMEYGIGSFVELYTALGAMKNRELLGNVSQTDPWTIVIMAEDIWMRLSDQGGEVLFETMYHDVPLGRQCFTYEAAYRYLADAVRRIIVREERIQVFWSGFGFTVLCTVLFSALMMAVQAGVLQAIIHIRTMTMQAWFACVAGGILLSALASAVLSKAVIKSFAREPSERRMRLGSTVVCYVIGTALILGSAYLLLSIWAFYETETPFYVYLSLTASFGMILFIGTAILLVTGKHRKRKRKTFPDNA